jgi:hypothetical protein
MMSVVTAASSLNGASSASASQANVRPAPPVDPSPSPEADNLLDRPFTPDEADAALKLQQLWRKQKELKSRPWLVMCAPSESLRFIPLC